MNYYKKPNIRFVDMAIYIDNHVYEDNYDADLIFEYLYHLANMLARKHKFFNREEYYNDYSIYLASRVFMRLTNKKQETGKLTKIKSCLNYMKSVLYPCKVCFEQEFYSQAILINPYEDYVNEYSLSNLMSESIDDLSMVDFNMCLGNASKTIKAFLKTIPYYQDRGLWEDIYISCLLSFLNSMTLKNKDIDRIKEFKLDSNAKINYIERLYKKESTDFVILYHLEDSMKGYIQVLVQEIKHLIAKDLSQSLHTYIPGVDNFNIIVSEVYGEEDE